MTIRHTVRTSPDDFPPGAYAHVTTLELYLPVGDYAISSMPIIRGTQQTTCNVRVIVDGVNVSNEMQAGPLGTVPTMFPTVTTFRNGSAKTVTIVGQVKVLAGIATACTSSRLDIWTVGP